MALFILTLYVVYLRRRAIESERACRRNVGDARTRYGPFYRDLVALGVCISDDRVMGKLLREGAVHLDTINRIAQGECRQLSLDVYRKTAGIGLASIAVSMIIYSLTREAVTAIVIFLISNSPGARTSVMSKT